MGILLGFAISLAAAAESFVFFCYNTEAQQDLVVVDQPAQASRIGVLETNDFVTKLQIAERWEDREQVYFLGTEEKSRAEFALKVERNGGAAEYVSATLATTLGCKRVL